MNRIPSHRIPSRRLVAAIGAALALTATASCSGDDDAAEPSAPVVTDDATDDTETTDDSGTGLDDTDVDTTPAPTDAAPSSDTTEPPPPTTEPEQPSEPPRLAGLTPVELTTEQQGGGDRPLLEWAPVDGVAVYGVYLYAPDGSIYWTWQGAATSVFVGGETQLPDSMPGPSVTDQMTWSVVGFDADFLPVAASDVRPIAP